MVILKILTDCHVVKNTPRNDSLFKYIFSIVQNEIISNKFNCKIKLKNIKNSNTNQLVPGHWFQSFAGEVFTYFGKKRAEKKFSYKPIIIGACPRSGTTLLLSVLGAHPNIFAIPDQTYAFNEWKEECDEATKRTIVVPSRPDRLYRTFLKYRIPNSKNRWCEKTPIHIKSFEKILEYYKENVQLINIFRDGRDIVTSKHPKHNPDQYWVSIERWIEDVSIGIKLDEHPQVLNIRYEDLVINFDETIKKIYIFLQEQIPSNYQNWIEQTNIKYSKHWGDSVKKFHSNSIGRWEKPEHKERVKELLKNEKAIELLKRLNYL